MNTRRLASLPLSLSLVTAVTALPLIVGCSQQAADGSDPQTYGAQQAPLMAGDPEPTFDPDLAVAPPPDSLSVSTVTVGDGWRKIRVYGKATDANSGALVPVDRELVVIEDKTKVSTAPIANFAKQEIEQEVTSSKTAYLAGTTVEQDEVDIIDPATAADAEAAMAAGTSTTPMMAFSCSNEEKTYEKSISTTKTYSHTKTTEAGSFTGSAAFTATLAASAKAKVKIKVYRSVWTACLPYKVSFRNVQFQGNADVTAKANVDAAFEKTWKYDKKVAQPSLGSLSFSIAGFPVKLNFSAPIHVGVEASAKATLKLDGSVTGKGSFDVTCTTSGCSGTKTATYGWTGGAAPTVGVNAKVNVAPYAYAGIHANLYTDWIANAELGVKAKIDGELWGYAGNTCGDADYNGTNEWVTGLTLNTRVGVDLIGKASVVGSDFGPWTWKLLDRHLAFWDLGSSGATTPMLNTKANPLGSTTAEAYGRMRPCWPFTDKMLYRVAWNDGSTTEFWETPSVQFSKLHTYAAYGSKIVSVTAVRDEKGRAPGKTRTDSINLQPLVFEPIKMYAL
ncbi:MAG: hypothetical protein HYV09_29040 [Deltaproteobacteria bacterium]|nr:hypothetical protein [Deltaproteobacteria bacterium]